jgi:hypothetical protein
MIKVIFYSRYAYKKQQDDIIKSLLQNSNIKLTILPDTVERKDLLNIVKNTNFDIFLHKNEHCALNTCRHIKDIISFCYENNKIPCYFDYGYFGHYHNYMLDYYLPNNQSSIKKVFADLPSDLKLIKPEIKKYIDNFKILCNSELKKNKKLEILGLHKDKFITIWSQYSIKLLRKNPNFRAEKTSVDWFNKIIEQINHKGLIPVIKTPPCGIDFDVKKIHGNPIILTSKSEQAKKLSLPFYENINIFLNVNSQAHVINCSSISNELLINDSKISATGISWFNDLNIFHEAQNWESLLNFQTPKIENINKWINWWNIRQSPKDKICIKIQEIFKEFYNEK